MKMRANDNQPTASDATTCAHGELERVRAWILVELISDDVDNMPLLADLAICDDRIARHAPRCARTRPLIYAVKT